jgi:Ser/Thr protein kinase RdoA (MazF antagonist)
MRHQVHHSTEATARQLEDPGYNDFGDDEEPHQAEVFQINPGQTAASPQTPEVVRHREEAAARLAKSARPRRSAQSQGRNAAFTLRLDAQRHLMLRLACTLEGRSAQQLVTEMLDGLIAELPDVAALAGKAPRRAKLS